MSSSLYTNLSWLPQPPPDLSERCRKLSASIVGGAEVPGSVIQALASHALDENQANRLAKLIGKAVAAGHSLAPLIPFRLGILSNSTVDLIRPVLVASAARHGILLECVQADYNQVIQEALEPTSIINASKPDGVLVAIDHRALPLRCEPGAAGAADETIDVALKYLRTIRHGIETNSQAACILQSFAPPPETLFGNLDRKVRGSMLDLLARINTGLAEEAAASTAVLLDVEQIAETVGLGEWHSPSQWNLAKLPFAVSCLPLYADHVARVIAAMRGRSRKCLVLDLDNTVWGGIIGDDGPDGIRIAEGDATGEAHLSVQRWALALRSRGVVLAVCSKNNDDLARTPFKSHPEMLLRENHIAVFQANWSDKASNIQAIADQLSLGVDAMVLLDDNPAERGLVRRLLPQVAVPELPDDPALYVRTLAAAGYFEAVSFSQEDTRRAAYYQENAQRVGLQKQSGDVAAYLASLNMEITFQPFDATGQTRIAQLINKSNQFNLTTRRYTEAEIAAIQADPGCFSMQVRLADSFGDNGMISVVICRHTACDQWTIDTWLMSCRVLGRRVQDMVLRELIGHALRGGINTLIGIYIPTPKNSLVKDHYPSLGFQPLGCDADGVCRWQLDVRTADVAAAPMTVRSSGFAATDRA